MLIRIIETNATVTLEHFFEMHPCLVLPQPPSNEDLVPHGARLVEPEPQPEPAPTEVPRWAGLLALKRHALDAGNLVFLGPEDDGVSSLHAQVIEYRSSMPAGEAADRMDAALNDAKDWLRMSPTVMQMSALLQLSAEQVDVLFVWAAGQVGSV